MVRHTAATAVTIEKDCRTVSVVAHAETGAGRSRRLLVAA
jgi:hypothetical protein